MSSQTIYGTDQVNYCRPDSGCYLLSKMIGRPSSCQGCRMKICTLDMPPGEVYHFKVFVLKYFRSEGD
ncbi:hypothetical protein ACFLXT_02660 [Chloroflexota bacterium]